MAHFNHAESSSLTPRDTQGKIRFKYWTVSNRCEAADREIRKGAPLFRGFSLKWGMRDLQIWVQSRCPSTFLMFSSCLQDQAWNSLSCNGRFKFRSWNIFQNRPLPTHTSMYRNTYARLDKMTSTEHPDIQQCIFTFAILGQLLLRFRLGKWFRQVCEHRHKHFANAMPCWSFLLVTNHRTQGGNGVQNFVQLKIKVAMNIMTLNLIKHDSFQTVASP